MSQKKLTEVEKRVIREVIQLIRSQPALEVGKSDISAITSGEVSPEIVRFIETAIRSVPATVEGVLRALDLAGTEDSPDLQGLTKRLVNVGQFTTPTGLWTLLPTFGSGDLPEWDIHERGKVDVKRWIFLPEARDKSREVQLELAYLENEQGVEPLERQLRKICDPLALKVILGVLYFCHQRGSGWFTYDPNSFLDVLGYKRNEKGYHQVANKDRIDHRINIFRKAKYRCEWTGGTKGRIPLEASLMLLDGDSDIEYIVDNQVVHKGRVVYFCGPLYDDIAKHKLYSWVDSRFLQLDANEYGRVIQLGTYYSTAWRIDWQNSKGKLHRKLRTILLDSGIHLTPTQEKRLIGSVRRDHDFMANQGLIKDWQIVEPAGNELDEIWEISIPDTHGLMIMRSNKGK